LSLKIEKTSNFMKIVFCALIVTMIFVSIGIPLDVLGYSFVAVTSNGVTFPITVSEINSSNSSGTGDSILDGLGVSLRIQNIDTNGKVYFGSGNNPGSQTTSDSMSVLEIMTIGQLR